jgi:two-component system LytT family response regulator
MDKIRAIIIDDEERATSVLTNLLYRDCPKVEIVTCCNNLLEGVESIKKTNPEVVFLDVQMPNYAGYEIGHFFERIDFEIVFVTAFDHYAIKAFELNAIDYLVKPIDRQKLAQTINKLEQKIRQKSALIDYQNLLKTIQHKTYNKLVIPELGNRRIVDLKDVVAIQADGAYSIFHLKAQKPFTTSKNLKYFEDVLPEETSFFRSHRGWIINLDHISSLNKTENLITLAGGQLKAKISRSRIEAFEYLIMKH